LSLSTLKYIGLSVAVLVSAAMTSSGDGAQDITFKGMGRLYSVQDEMAKPMCANNQMQLGEYLIHYTKIGMRSSNAEIYPFVVYAPQEAPMVFVSCEDRLASCGKPTIRAGSTWSQMHLMQNYPVGEMMVVVGSLSSLEEVSALRSEVLTLTEGNNAARFKVISKLVKGAAAQQILTLLEPGGC